jgi:hypothetical protein
MIRIIVVKISKMFKIYTNKAVFSNFNKKKNVIKK